MASNQPTFSIVDLAREFDVTTRTIRFYEEHGLLAPTRRGNRRVYAPRDQTRLKLIMRGKRLGFSIAEIKEMIELYDARRGAERQLRLFIDKIGERRALLLQQRQDIQVILDELDGLEARCRDLLAERAD
ncbi:MAG: MerR family DNA-binding transcriptional regulator [Alphaproteobacteria bacterium]|nr:MerR family DNA-binding transcriptional regulator [Alphaproteobacteria bacterium]